MSTDEHDLMRRAVRDAVFHAGRLRMNGRIAAADELLASELLAAQGRLGASGSIDAAGIVRKWFTEDDAAFALAQLVSELVSERLHPSSPPQARLSIEGPAVSPHSPASTRPNGSAAPDLADLLDGMFIEERRAKRPSP